MVTRGRLRVLLTSLLYVLLASCKSHGVHESLDSETFVSVITARPAVALYRQTLSGGYSRDFVHAGPVEVVASSDRGYYLWLSFWGTLPDGSYRLVEQPEQVVVHAAGRRIPLRRATQGQGLLRLSRPAYDTPLPGAGNGYFAIDEATLVALADEQAFAVQVGEDEYVLWIDQEHALQALRDFVSEATSY